MKRWPALLAGAVVLRLAFHAVFVPAFEGPDEPHHLARVAAFAAQPLPRAWAGGEVDGAILAAVRAHPCGPSLASAYGCRPFGGDSAAFNLLSLRVPRAPAAGAPNPESNQPPLLYLLAALPLRPWRPLAPEILLLYVRLFNVGLVTVALLGPLRLLAGARPSLFAIGGLLCLLLPGAAEALARCSNDAAVFLWSALVLAALERRRRGAAMVALLAAGPLLKLTAIPVVVFAVVALWKEGHRRVAAAGAAAACLVFPVQWLRGWAWGGTVELNSATAPLPETAGPLLLGLLRSLYTFLKTTFWLGEWSFFRAPRFLVVVFGLLLLAWLLAARRRADPRRLSAHLAAAAAAMGGFFTFAVANRRLYGVWGGVGGWYAWGWSPWLAVALGDLLTLSERSERVLLAATALFVLAANLVWFLHAFRIYG